MSSSVMPPLRPLGGLAPASSDDRWSAERLLREPRLSADLKESLVNYLQACPVFLAWMEHTRDEIGNKFGVDGGSAILSDGTYFWRADAAEYVRFYGVSVPPEAIRHFESREWTPPAFDRAEYLRIYVRLEQILGVAEIE